MSVQTRIRCDHDQCARTLPLDGKHDRSSLRYQAASEQWDVSDEGDFCPRHKPGVEFVPCGAPHWLTSDATDDIKRKYVACHCQIAEDHDGRGRTWTTEWVKA